MEPEGALWAQCFPEASSGGAETKGDLGSQASPRAGRGSLRYREEEERQARRRRRKQRPRKEVGR